MNSPSYSVNSDINFVVTGEPQSEEWDYLFVALGYEERCVHAARAYSAKARARIALCFDSLETLSYGQNASTLTELGFSFEEMPDDVGLRIFERFKLQGVAPVRVAIDISSFTRRHLAEIVDTIRSLKSACVIDFLYSPAAGSGWTTDAGAIQVAQPVHPGFTSWIDDPAAPLAALIGVGVEDNLALGIAEYLDVSYAHAFVPTGGDLEFDELNSHANSQFFLAEYTVRRSEYEIGEPFRLFLRLESLIYGIPSTVRVAIVPLGPKIFALCGLLAAAVSHRSTTVWRFSSDGYASPQERIAAGPIHSIRVRVDGREACSG